MDVTARSQKPPHNVVATVLGALQTSASLLVGRQRAAEALKLLSASTLGSLAKGGVLTELVDCFDARSSTAAALATASLAKNEVPVDEGGDSLAASSQAPSRRALHTLLSLAQQPLKRLFTVKRQHYPRMKQKLLLEVWARRLPNGNASLPQKGEAGAARCCER